MTGGDCQQLAHPALQMLLNGLQMFFRQVEAFVALEPEPDHTAEVKMKVAANSREEAEQFARDQWKRGEVVLDANHFTGVEFHAKRYSRDRGE